MDIGNLDKINEMFGLLGIDTTPDTYFWNNPLNSKTNPFDRYGNYSFSSTDYNTLIDATSLYNAFFESEQTKR